MEECVKTAAEVGAKIMAGPLYSPVGYLPGRRRTADEWKWAVDCYQSLGPVLQQYSVTIAIEPLNRFETYFLNTAQDAAALCDQIGHPNVGVLFDTFHANIEEKDIAAGYRTVGKYRRVRFDDLMAYKRKDDEARAKILDQLTAEAQELGMGY